MDAPQIGNLRVVLVEQMLWQHSVTDLLRIVHQLLQGDLFGIFCQLLFAILIYPVEVLSAHKDRQVVHVADLLVDHDTEGGTALPGARRSSRPMDEELHLGREIVVDDVLEERDIDTSSCQVCHDQHTDPLLAELEEFVLARPLVHGTVDVVGLEATFLTKLVKVLDVVLRRAEYNRLLLIFDVLPQNVEES